MAYNFSAQYNFDWNSTDTIWGFNGTDTNISYVAGLKWSAASFNWASSVITTGYASSGDQWISMWINPTSTGTDRGLVANNSWGNNFLIVVSNAWKIQVRNQAWSFWNETGTSVTNGTWQHFIFMCRTVEAPPTVYTAYVDIYKNGSFIETLTVWWSAETWLSVGLVIWRNSTWSYYYSWLIEHLTIWQGTLSAGERSALYNGWIPPTIPFKWWFFHFF